MAEKTQQSSKVKTLIDQVKYYWKKPAKGRYMSFKEIASYAFGGIGAYLIVCMSYPCILGATNVFLSGTIGIGLTDMYIMYVIAILSGIPLTGLRANIVDNTRNKAGKYRPYLLRMGIPCAIIFVAMVWFPYDKLHLIVGDGQMFGKSSEYIAKCAVILAFNIALQFFYNFFYDAYENLIHVLSPNSQERADVASIKSVIYSFGPTVYNLIIPLIAAMLKTNQTDIKVYRIAFPVIGVIGTLLVFIVYANTQEKIIQAKTHVIQIKFTDALREVAKNKYFWIISLATWIGFLETAYSNILYWLCNYGGACSQGTYAIITTVYGNASLWGMLLAPLCIRKWGKKKVQIVTNLFNIMFILCMYPFFHGSAGPDGNIRNYVIWAVLACLYLNGIVGAFAHILNPSIQADIRDYQQYRTGERIDGMFAAVAAIGSIITLITAGVLPALQEKYGMTAAMAQKVTSDSSLMSRVLPGTQQPISQMLSDQLANGQNNFINPSSALYNVDGILLPLLRVLVLVAAVGATLNVIPFFFYDLTEKKQKSYVRVLKVRAVFEDYGNNAMKDKDIVEMIDLVNNAKEMAVATPKVVDKSSYKGISDKAERKAAKKAYREALEFNEEIEISQFVVDELNKFNSELGKHKLEAYNKIFKAGLDGIKNTSLDDAKAQLAQAKAMPANTEEEKEIRKFYIELAKNQISAIKAYNKYFGSVNEFKELGFETIEQYFNKEDELDEKIAELAKLSHIARKDKDSSEVKRLKAEIKKLSEERKEVRKLSKAEMDKHAQFNRAAKPYVDAKKLLTQQENFSHFDEIAAQYETAKANVALAEKQEAEEEAKRLAEEKEELERRKAEKAAKKASKK
ncbi:MFS transporter [uncultured Eubacterium sp.]|uniref:MFS transporter n=1 Tax=uncultured Eubacterium sp. TaxID=165185 RepID=UPI00258EB687|nr:MFS transporter [uncultured Eubacterium sp.]